MREVDKRIDIKRKKREEEEAAERRIMKEMEEANKLMQSVSPPVLGMEGENYSSPMSALKPKGQLNSSQGTEDATTIETMSKKSHRGKKKKGRGKRGSITDSMAISQLAG